MTDSCALPAGALAERGSPQELRGGVWLVTVYVRGDRHRLQLLNGSSFWGPGKPFFLGSLSASQQTSKVAINFVFYKNRG